MFNRKQNFFLNTFKQIRYISNYKYISGAEIAYKSLSKYTNDVFLYSGGSIMPLIDHFHPSKNKYNLNYYINTHEQNSGHAATGYAKSSNKTGVVITTSGPGITNMTTPILDALNDSTPLVVISGQVGLENMGTDAFQEAPAIEITKNITKFSHCIKSINEIELIIDMAFNIANDGKKGPVHIDIPKCVLTDTILKNKEKNYNIKEIKKIFNKNENYVNMTTKDLKNVADVINNSEKPIFYIGQGCVNGHYGLLNIINTFNIPCTSTIHGKGILDETHELSLQWCGMHGLAAANYAIQESDCIICVGARFDDRTTGNTKFYAPEATEKKQIIHIDIEKKQFNKSIKSNYNLECDSSVFLNSLYYNLENVNRNNWINRIKKLKYKYPFKYRLPKENKLNTPLVINSINNYLNKNNKDYHISTGVGNHQMMTYQFITGKNPKKIHSSGSLGVMGAGLPYAIGIQIANPDSLVIDIDGDSSFMMTMNDLKTIKEYNLPVKIAIMNDSRQMMVNIWERLFFEERYTATINNNNPDFCSLAESFGIKSFRCVYNNILDHTTKSFLDYDGPALCEYVVEPDICLPLVGPGKALDDMILFDDYHSNVSNLNFDNSSIPS